jgi:hypothetical protein
MGGDGANVAVIHSARVATEQKMKIKADLYGGFAPTRQAGR